MYNNTCTYIQPSVTRPEIDKYLSGNNWKKKNYITNVMHEAVNKSIDLIIQAICTTSTGLSEKVSKIHVIYARQD